MKIRTYAVALASVISLSVAAQTTTETAASRKEKEAVRAQELKREYDAEQAQYWKQIEDGKKQLAIDEAAQKKKCGKDFGKIRVGMALDRFEECTDGLAYETDTVSKAGVVETYRSTFYYVHAKDGKIVAFTHRQD